MSRTRAFAVLAVFAVIVVVLSTPAISQTPKGGGTLNVTQREDLPQGFAIHETSTISSVWPVMPCFNNLVLFDPLKKTESMETIIGELAEKWSWQDNYRNVVFFLRKNVKWHDGQPFTAKDVKFTFDMLREAPDASAKLRINPRKDWYSNIQNIETPDPHTVVFHLSRVVIDFPYYVGSSTYQAVILPANWPGHFAKNPIGTGAFKLVEYVPGQRARYIKNPTYWNKGLPYLDEIRFTLNVGPEAQVTQLLGGSVDYATGISENSIPVLRANPNVKIRAAHSAFYNGIFVRTDKAPFNDKRVRQAMALCLDRRAVITGVQHGFGLIGNDHVVSRVFPLFSPIAQRTQDFARARTLLSAAGYPHGFSATLTTTSDTADLVSLALVAQQMWKRVGINVKLKPEPGSVYYNSDWLQAPLSITEWASRPTPSQMLNLAYRSTAVWNASHWVNHTFDRLTNGLDATLDFTKRKAIVKQIERLMTDDVPSLVPAFNDTVYFIGSNVQGITPNPDGNTVWKRVSLSS